jgi:hypothetical protein
MRQQSDQSLRALTLECHTLNRNKPIQSSKKEKELLGVQHIPPLRLDDAYHARVFPKLKPPKKTQS